MSTTELDTVKTTKPESQSQNWRRPHYDVFESDDAFDVRVSIPGTEREGVDISIQGDDLNITAKRSSVERDTWRPLRKELPEGDFHLNLRLNVAVNEDKIKAQVENGILNLLLPKADKCKTRKIKVN